MVHSRVLRKSKMKILLFSIWIEIALSKSAKGKYLERFKTKRLEYYEGHKCYSKIQSLEKVKNCYQRTMKVYDSSNKL